MTKQNKGTLTGDCLDKLPNDLQEDVINKIKWQAIADLHSIEDPFWEGAPEVLYCVLCPRHFDFNFDADVDNNYYYRSNKLVYLFEWSFDWAFMPFINSKGMHYAKQAFICSIDANNINLTKEIIKKLCSHRDLIDLDFAEYIEITLTMSPQLINTWKKYRPKLTKNILIGIADERNEVVEEEEELHGKPYHEIIGGYENFKDTWEHDSSLDGTEFMRRMRESEEIVA